ncbi:MAG: hypothetical protein IJS46_01015, partial [Kiritimatiellae bacterium]|nr:hypothetical protein [Kiritimatiellia bacterium]
MKAPQAFLRTAAALAAACALALPSASPAADLTVDTATDYTGSGSSYDNIYLNADFSLGTDETRGAFTLNNGKKIFLPGTDNGSATFTFRNGQMATGNATSGFNIGYGTGGHTGGGLIVVSNIDSYNGGQKMSKLGLVQIGDKATASGGQVDFLRIDAGLLEVSGTQNGSWRRAGVSKIANYRTDSVPARILLTGAGGALCPNQNQASQFFLCDAAGSVTAVEGDGADIVFMTGQWLENSGKTMTKVIPLIDTASAGILRFQGDCDVVFHNHNAGTAADDAQYGFSLGLGTNHVVWAQTGDIVVSNACTLLTAADYALPNGAQTARVVFRDKDGTSEPALDLCGTTQRANGVVSEIAASGALRGVVTNSSAAAATHVLGADGADCALKVGRVCGGVTVRKAGAGT